MAALTLQEQFGQIDIYLFDQLLKGRITPGMRILDAGCGWGRNIVYFLREGYEVYAADADAEAVEGVRGLARRFAPGLPDSNFRVEPVEGMSFEDACADVVISNTVLHFARDDAHFEAMLMGTWRVLRPGGLFFCRLGSMIGMESRVECVQGRRYRSPDGPERYLVDEELVGRFTDRLGGIPADPLKTTVVQNLRSMTTWVLRKGLAERLPEGEGALSRRHGKLAPRLATTARTTQSPFGALRSEFELPEGWDRPFSADEADAFWEGSDRPSRYEHSAVDSGGS
jgi:SAM-dependent methyltransferase